MFFCKQKTAYEVRISDWSSDVCSSDLPRAGAARSGRPDRRPKRAEERVRHLVTHQRVPESPIFGQRADADAWATAANACPLNNFTPISGHADRKSVV